MFVRRIFLLNVENSKFISNHVLKPKGANGILVTCIIEFIKFSDVIVKVYGKEKVNHKLMEFILSSLHVSESFETQLA